MGYDYDKLYASTPDALGPPTPDLVKAFESLLPARARVLDLGCGQGRDALWLARAGHAVVGVDTSPHGIRDMIGAAVAENLDVSAEVADLCAFRPNGTFDVLLADRTFHMILDDAERHGAFKRLLAAVAPGGLVLIADEKSNIPGLAACLPEGWEVLKSPAAYLFARGPSA